jgi:hypothetical protein
MSEQKTCLRCGGSDLKSGSFQSTGRVYFRSEGARLVTVLTGGVPVGAEVCFSCGHVELLVDAKRVRSLSRVS